MFPELIEFSTIIKYGSSISDGSFRSWQGDVIKFRCLDEWTLGIGRLQIKYFVADFDQSFVMASLTGS